jgi:hypothetical protein
MGADRSHHRIRPGKTVAGLMVLGILMAGGGSATAPAAVTPAQLHQAGEGPTTIAGCKQRYPKFDTDQAACLLRVHITLSKCEVYPLPCIGHILSEYNMDCDGGSWSPGATKLLWANCDGRGVIEMAPGGNPERQPFVWHSIPSVKIVAVFIIHNGVRRDTLQPVPTGAHSGHVILKWFRQARQPIGPDAGPPRLLLEGKRVG